MHNYDNLQTKKTVKQCQQHFIVGLGCNISIREMTNLNLAEHLLS
jgi:hypothetical protein